MLHFTAKTELAEGDTCNEVDLKRFCAYRLVCLQHLDKDGTCMKRKYNVIGAIA